jgi:HEAT repeat protein
VHSRQPGETESASDGLDARAHAHSSRLGQVARAVGAGTCDVARVSRHDLQVIGIGADVGAGVVAPAHLLDVATDQRQRSVAVELVDVHDHGLAAAARDAGDRTFPRHRLGQPERVGQRLDRSTVGTSPDPAECRSEPRVVHGDERQQTGHVVAQHLDLLELGDQELVQFHRRDRFSVAPQAFCERGRYDAGILGKTREGNQLPSIEACQTMSCPSAPCRPRNGNPTTMACLVVLAGCASAPIGEPDPALEAEFQKQRAEQQAAAQRQEALPRVLTDLDKALDKYVEAMMSSGNERADNLAQTLERLIRDQVNKHFAELRTTADTSGFPRNRAIAVAALGFSRREEALDPLLNAVEDENLEVSTNAVFGLAILADVRTPPATIARVMLDKSRPDPSRAGAAWALYRLQGAIHQPERVAPFWLEILEQSVEETSPSVLVSVLRGIGLFRDPRYADAVAKYASHPTPLVRQVAAIALGRLGDPKIVPTLLTLLGPEETNENVRLAARKALQRLAGDVDRGYDVAQWRKVPAATRNPCRCRPTTGRPRSCCRCCSRDATARGSGPSIAVRSSSVAVQAATTRRSRCRFPTTCGWMVSTEHTCWHAETGPGCGWMTVDHASSRAPRSRPGPHCAACSARCCCSRCTRSPSRGASARTDSNSRSRTVRPGRSTTTGSPSCRDGWHARQRPTKRSCSSRISTPA